MRSAVVGQTSGIKRRGTSTDWHAGSRKGDAGSSAFLRVPDSSLISELVVNKVHS